MAIRKPATGVAVITGGAAGIGEAIVRRLSADGFAVVIADLDGNRADGIATEISAHGGQAAGKQVDVSATQSVAALFDWLTDDLGRCDVLVNNAGIAITASVSELPLERWNSTIAVNVTGALLMAQHAIPLMKKGGWGRVVNISSISGVRASAGRIAYGTSKAAIIGLTRQLAIELAPDNITVNSVAPGPVDTATARAVHTELTRQNYAAADSDEALWQAGGNRRRSVLSLLRGCVVHHRAHDSGRRWLSRGRCP